LFEAPEEYEALNRQAVLDAVVEKKRRPPERFVNLRMALSQHAVQPGLEKESQGDTSHENAAEVRHQRSNCILEWIHGKTPVSRKLARNQFTKKRNFGLPGSIPLRIAKQPKKPS